MRINPLEAVPDAVCPGCGGTGGVHKDTRLVYVTGELGNKIVLLCRKPVRVCCGCGAEFENTQDGDWRAAAYAAMKKMEGKT